MQPERPASVRNAAVVAASQMSAVRTWIALDLLAALTASCSLTVAPRGAMFHAPVAPALPMSPIAVASRVNRLFLGTFNTCALSDKGRLRCWGDDRNGVLGQVEPRDIGDDEVPSAGADVPIGERTSDVACGLLHACAVTQLGHVACWGRWRPVVYPAGWVRAVDVLRLNTPAIQVAAGQSHTCALLASGALRCWGKGRDGASWKGYERGDRGRKIEHGARVGQRHRLSRGQTRHGHLFASDLGVASPG
jgi:Regulator of chromosome condensation (RCC1) repeat